ncbi:MULTISPECIES: glycosyl hydrolase 115 family protein [unclassified Microbulbifer]|uniref:glycosyl hydrolase 115 family protein n=1 Tax=unclassified Microbulbifer TaxID=2619833 RepID=UPI0027E47531|nr:MULTISPECIES: glycosyl hydrolase 115 family protein [unclassified Microbulbifer]
MPRVRVPPAPSAAEILLFLIGILLTPAVLALGGAPYVTTESQPGAVQLHGAGLYVDSADHKGVQRAAATLAGDLERVTGQRPQIRQAVSQTGEKHAVIAGTIGRSALIDQLIASGRIDPAAIAGRWEGYHIETVQQPLPGVERALVIAGSDKRGTIYGIYDLSEQIGVSPWHWWADLPPEKKPRLYARANTLVQDAPEVQYRGIFLNDEAPALSGWVKETFGDYNHDFYEKVFELLLRLKANYLWPAMWNNAFADDDPQNMILADEYGIVMGTSHHEPMMRADKEWNRYGEGPWEYSSNAKNLRDFWKDGVTRNKPYESLYTLGMRGQADTPMSEGQNVALLEQIVDHQREILTRAFGDPQSVPQVWALYKEVQGFYEKGMRVPEDVTLLWSDDNWGNIRRLPTADERGRSGGAGVYYHFDYVGGPRSYRWINTVPIAKVWEQMNLAQAYEAKKIWIVNVGDLKPMEFPTEFFLRLAWSPESWPRERLREFGRLWAAREFGAEYAEEIEALVSGYTRHNGRRKPEQQDADTYSLLHYREAERIEAELDQLVDRAEALYGKLPQNRRDAFYQLVLHPVKASATITKMYTATARNRLYARQGRTEAQVWADRARELFEQDSLLEDYFHRELAGGKWNHMMSQPRIGYTHWNNPPANTLPMLYSYEPHGQADMGVAVEGMARAWPEPGDYRLPEFSPYGQPSRRLEIYNRGTAPFDFKVDSSAPWIRVSRVEGSVKVSETLEVSIDWDAAPAGRSEGHMHITGTGWGGARVGVSAFNPSPQQKRAARGFVEADGYVSIEAGHFNRKGGADGIAWEEIPGHGRTRSSMSVFPVTDRSFDQPQRAPWLEYDIYFFSAGEFEVSGYFAPTQAIVPGRGLRYALALDGGEPQVVDLLEGLDQSRWAREVSDGVRLAKSRLQVTKPGLHQLRIYALDPAVTLQKIVIDTGGLQPSYLGSPESVRIN